MTEAELTLARKLDLLAKTPLDLEGVQAVEVTVLQGVLYLDVDGRTLARIETGNVFFAAKANKGA